MVQHRVPRESQFSRVRLRKLQLDMNNLATDGETEITYVWGVRRLHFAAFSILDGALIVLLKKLGRGKKKVFYPHLVDKGGGGGGGGGYA